MEIIDIIAKKRDGLKLNKEEIDFFVQEVVKERVADYQIAAFLMAVYINDMDTEEAYNLTNAMVETGQKVYIKGISEFSFDKHSTGGVGDKLSLVIIPLVASFGYPALKMSGRGLGITGGTLDKLESIPGFRVELSEEEIIKQAEEIGAVLCAQTKSLAPADKIFYKLRDVTATIDSIPLIASSIMSKKLAIQNKALVIDLKLGEGAFMKDLKSAERLANLMLEIANKNGRKAKILISQMEAPIGYTVGNSLEVIEAIEILQGKKDTSAYDSIVEIASAIISLLDEKADAGDIRKKVEEKLANHEAYEVFLKMVASQGGDVTFVEDISKFQLSKLAIQVKAERNGYVNYNAKNFGLISLHAGSGRQKKEDEIDYGAGIYIVKPNNSYVNKGDVLFNIYSNRDAMNFSQYVDGSYMITNDKKQDDRIIKVI